MTEQYDPRQYAIMANKDFGGVEVMPLGSKKRHKEIIKVYKVTDLSWHKLQIMGINGTDRYTKMVNLYDTLLMEED